MDENNNLKSSNATGSSGTRLTPEERLQNGLGRTQNSSTGGAGANMQNRPNSPQPNRPNMSNTNAPRYANSNTQNGNVGVRLTPEERLQKSAKKLSYTAGSGVGQSGLNSQSQPDLSKYTNKAYANQNSANERKKVGGVVLDMDTIQDVTNQKMNTRDKRNNVIILILVLALVVSLVFLTITIVNYKKSGEPNNCFFKIEGDAGSSCQWLIEGRKDVEFKVPQPNVEDGESLVDKIYKIKTQLIVNTSETVMLVINIKAEYKGGEFIIHSLTGANEQLVRSSKENNVFVFNGTISGGGTIDLFDGIDFTDAPYGLTSKNIILTITATVTKQNV